MRRQGLPVILNLGTENAAQADQQLRFAGDRLHAGQKQQATTFGERAWQDIRLALGGRDKRERTVTATGVNPTAEGGAR
jgi:hypothetical protein